MQIKLLLGANAMFALLCCSASGQLPTPSPADLPVPPYATITYADGSSVIAPAAGVKFPLVGLPSNQPVEVTIQYDPIQDRGKVVFIQALDGGTLIPSVGLVGFAQPCNSPVAPSICFALGNVLDSTLESVKVRFTFAPGLLPGSYRLVLRDTTRTMLLQFWVADPNNPQNNPPAITPAQPDNY